MPHPETDPVPDAAEQETVAVIRGAIEQGRTIYLASPTARNLVQSSGRFAVPTIVARELNVLRDAGYWRSGDDLLPPT